MPAGVESFGVEDFRVEDFGSDDFRDGIEFCKGHGTQNDFVLLPDPDGALALTPQRVRALCDRQSGLGADGVLRVVRTRALPDAPADLDADSWFMDYRNADGSLAEMCGNGVRVFARYLVAAGLADRGEFAVGTRAGTRAVTVQPDDTVTVGMGPARVLGASTAVLTGTAYPGTGVDVGNPHLVCVLDGGSTAGDVAELDLTVAPGYDAAVFPEGVNVEFVHVLDAGRIRMRVYERGVGETRACGTGTVAAVAAVLHADARPTGECVVELPGGTVTVTVGAECSTLRGPAELVAHGRLSASWWAAADM